MKGEAGQRERGGEGRDREKENEKDTGRVRNTLS